MNPPGYRTKNALKRFLVGCAILCAHGLYLQGASFDWDQLRQRARQLAEKPYAEPSEKELPKFLKDLDYNGYQQIRFRSEEAPWKGEDLDFEVHFYHRGFLYTKPVSIHLIEGEEVRPFPFSPSLFRYGDQRFPEPAPEGLGYAGVLIFHPLVKPGEKQEVASFLGPTYFRLLGAGQRYGASARALSIDTAEPKGEEFAHFTDFWVRKPSPESESIELFALLDSPSAAGAYRFLITPGKHTDIAVEASLFPRTEGKKLGWAPLTSMYLMGENRTRHIPDFRPEVHDSDGLLIVDGDKSSLWRPLTNPMERHRVSRFPVTNLKGFGLMQRDRDFQNYQDLETRYDLHPSLWIKPGGGWGAGRIELVEIPTDSEHHDNIVSYWIADREVNAGEELRWEYHISAALEGSALTAAWQVESTHVANLEEGKTKFVIDFAAASEGETTKGPTPVVSEVAATNGTIQNVVTQQNQVTGGWRTTFEVVAPKEEDIELKAYLSRGKERISETWVYHLRNP